MSKYLNLLNRVSQFYQNTNSNLDSVVVEFMKDDLRRYSEVNYGVCLDVLLEFDGERATLVGDGRRFNGNLINEKIEGVLVPCLQIHDPIYFLTLLSRLVQIANEKGRDLPWIDYPHEEISYIRRLLNRIWFNATNEDFENPNRYLEMVISELEDNTFDNYLNDCTPLGYMDKFGYEMALVDMYQGWAYETPRAFEFYFFDRKIIGEDSFARIPTIRFGMNGKSAVVYAAQMPSAKGADVESKKDLFMNYPEDTIMQNKIRRTAYKIDSNIENSNVFRPAYISLAATLSILSAYKVETIKVQTMLPLRLMEHMLNEIKTDGEGTEFEYSKLIYRATSEKFRELFIYMAQIVDGFSQIEEENDADNLTFRIEAKLSCQNQVINEILVNTAEIVSRR